MTLDELVEKVARAIIEADGNDPDLCLDDDGEPWWKDYTPNARAVLASLAASGYAVVPVEATMNMRWAGRQHFIEQSGGKQFLSTVNVAEFWCAMLVAAQEDSHE